MRNFKSIGIIAAIATALSVAKSSREEGHRVASDRTIERRFFRTYGPGRNQRKRRKLARQSPNCSKWRR
jgi:hypothetical protein